MTKDRQKIKRQQIFETKVSGSGSSGIQKIMDLDPDLVCPERLDPNPGLVCPVKLDLDPDPVNIRPDTKPFR